METARDTKDHNGSDSEADRRDGDRGGPISSPDAAIATSTSTGALAAALAKAQSAIKHAIKDKRNPHFGSQYADLASVWHACREPLTANGLAVVQPVGELEVLRFGGGLAGTGETLLVVPITTVLLHSSGERLASTSTTPVGKPYNAQTVVAAITYGRRAALAAVVGVAPDDDDDGEVAVGRGDEQRKEKNLKWLAEQQATITPKPAPGPASDLADMDDTDALSYWSAKIDNAKTVADLKSVSAAIGKHVAKARPVYTTLVDIGKARAEALRTGDARGSI